MNNELEYYAKTITDFKDTPLEEMFGDDKVTADEFRRAEEIAQAMLQTLIVEDKTEPLNGMHMLFLMHSLLFGMLVYQSSPDARHLILEEVNDSTSIADACQHFDQAYAVTRFNNQMRRAAEFFRGLTGKKRPPAS